jgi:hypothetical protein
LFHSQWCKPLFPLAHGLMGEGEST